MYNSSLTHVDKKYYIQTNVRDLLSIKSSFQKNKLYNEFWKNYFLAGYDDTVKKYIREKNMPLKRKISLIFNDTAWIFPKEIREKLIKIRDKK